MYNCPRSSFPSLTASWPMAKCQTSSGWMGIAKSDVRPPGKGTLCTNPRACSISVKVTRSDREIPLLDILRPTYHDIEISVGGIGPRDEVQFEL